jgi:phage gpG-like protein
MSASGEGHFETLSATELVIGTNLDYAPLQQFGGTIAPVNAKMLAIPLTKEAQRAGTARRFPGKLHAAVKDGKGVLLDSEGVAQYALTKGPIKIPARPFAGFSEKAIDRIQKIFVEYLGGLIQ